ncbi:hypothetical protein FOYG_17559 [Fusarium oxysporum NRRL 32931]|uniref:Protein kinase domain-containing protein n=1 Tax=Fusarium oxysporum NRRL 32931 TaxID=660029 RepID=W9H9K3_FUSOX|nr:hypothetical protein FOYG_17559 [Fusarium oxysporum NRRL 32931]
MAERYEIPSFISQDPKEGDPAITWDAFERPKLRKFYGDIVLDRYIGGGMDGIVIKARDKHRGRSVAVKVFYFNNQPPPIDARPALSISNHMDSQNPLRKKQCQAQHYKGAPRYWAFQRECINIALLEKIDASLRLAEKSGREILLNLEPTTAREAYRNLKSFSTESCDREPEADKLKPFRPNVRINPCYGWTQLSRAAINARFQEPSAFQDEEQYFAIVYDFVLEGQLEAKNVINQLNYFHITGFLNVQLNLENWLSTGVLVDFSDIVPLHTGWKWWRKIEYRDNNFGFRDEEYIAESIRRFNERRYKSTRTAI